MVEATILVIIASGLWVMASQMRKSNQMILPAPQDDNRRALTRIVEGGLYRLSAPGETLRFSAFTALHLVEGGIGWQDTQTTQHHIVDFATMQWVSAVTMTPEKIASLSIHIEVKGHWRILTLQMPEAEMATLVKVLRRAINQSRMNIGRPPATPIGPLAAHVAEDTLQGKSNLGAEVSLYLLPHMLVVLQGDYVRAKLDTSSIRRVLSVERITGKLDSLLHRTTPEGVIRLYSLYETVAFALPQYRELAEEISYLSRCPVEFITQEDKSSKG